MIPQAKSIGEETFALHCKARGLEPELEFVFLPPRKYRFDFAFPECKVCVEIEGGTSYGKSRHSRGDGFEGDCRKYNLAARNGWKILRYTTAMVQRGEAIEEVLATVKHDNLSDGLTAVPGDENGIFMEDVFSRSGRSRPGGD